MVNETTKLLSMTPLRFTDKGPPRDAYSLPNGQSPVNIVLATGNTMAALYKLHVSKRESITVL